MTARPTSSAYPTLPESIRRHSRVVVAAALALMVLAGLWAFLGTPVAEAQARIGLRFPAPGNVLMPVPTGDQSVRRYAAQRAQFATSDQVVDAAAALTELSRDQVRRWVVVEPSGSGNVLVVTAEHDSAEGAVALANAVVTAYREQTRNDVTERWTMRADGLRSSGFPGLASNALADLDAFGDGVEFTTSATEDTASTRGLPLRAMLIGLLAGLGLSSLAVWAMDIMRINRQQGQGEPTDGAQLVADVPANPGTAGSVG